MNKENLDSVYYIICDALEDIKNENDIYHVKIDNLIKHLENVKLDSHFNYMKKQIRSNFLPQDLKHMTMVLKAMQCDLLIATQMES